ncbi:rhodanese-like domain-containing protein [Flavobacterium rhizosphaerae]|uniref:Rhodanese-like domain-containing protein n=1 Tax=Flavobacterium rhizosphaerae TaxID=3163298 RepID=A0ABW8YRU2_9FLAO
MKKIMAILALGLALTGCKKEHAKSAELVEPAAFYTAVKQDGVQVIDVRTPEEYNSGHIANAVNIDINENDFAQRLDSLDKDKAVYVYCRSGGRSAKAVDMLKAKSFTNIIELNGGIEAWQKAEKPVEN